MTSYKSSHLDSVVYIEMPEQLLKDGVRAFEENSVAWLKKSAMTYIFDFRNLEKIHSSVYVHFMSFKSEAQKRNAKVLSINFRPSILQQIRSEGMERNFGYVSELKGLDASSHKDSQAEVRANIIRYLIEAARAAMNIMFKTTVAADENFRENQNNFKVEKFYRAAAIHAECAALKANFRLYFDRPILGELTKIMLEMKTIPADEELLESTATELLNLIYGGAKSKLNSDRGYGLPGAIPHLVPIENINSLRSKNPKNVSLIPLVTPVGAYYLEVEFV